MARTLLDSALLYIDRQDLQAAMLQLKKAEKLLPELENAKTKYQICQYIGWINETSGADELALHYQGLALDYAQEYGKPELVVDVLINQANTLYNMGLNDSAWSTTLEAARYYEQADRGVAEEFQALVVLAGRLRAFVRSLDERQIQQLGIVKLVSDPFLKTDGPLQKFM